MLQENFVNCVNDSLQPSADKEVSYCHIFSPQKHVQGFKDLRVFNNVWISQGYVSSAIVKQQRYISNFLF